MYNSAKLIKRKEVEIALGKQVSYPTKYEPTILFPIERKINREKINLSRNFFGYDIWNCYEVSWLDRNGKPNVRILEIFIPADSACIIESKSLKLYLFSLNNEKFESDSEIFSLIKKDLEKIVGTEIEIFLRKVEEFDNIKISRPSGICIDNVNLIESDKFGHKMLIINNDKIVEEELYTDLHKSNCLITSQPDWATLMIKYKGPEIEKSSLLSYIVSHRNVDMFHEDSVETIFSDILSSGEFEDLIVYARYTRRGGIDINPIRSLKPISGIKELNIRLARQ